MKRNKQENQKDTRDLAGRIVQSLRKWAPERVAMIAPAVRQIREWAALSRDSDQPLDSLRGGDGDECKGV